MIGENWSTTKRNARILALPKRATVCCCGAPGGSEHDHMTGRVVGAPWPHEVKLRASLADVLGFIDGWDGPITIEELAEAFAAEESAVLRETLIGAARGGYLSNRLGIYTITPKGRARGRTVALRRKRRR